MLRTALAVALTGVLTTTALGQEPTTAKSRTFQFTYKVSVTGVPRGEKAKVWVPMPRSDSGQDVRVLATDLPGGCTSKISEDKTYGNKIFYVESAPNVVGNVVFWVTYQITRRELRGPVSTKGESEKELARYLRADRLVPTEGKPLELLKGKELPKEEDKMALELYKLVESHMKYDKSGEGWGNGDASWACASGKGNCTDFHSLFISLARSRKITAKFEIGFPLPRKRGEGVVEGYHCWAKFHLPGKGWVPVDISEADKHPEMKDYYFGNLTEDRVAFTVGRDITLVPEQSGEPLNYFVYPYVEVGGKLWPKDKIDKHFSFKDFVSSGP